MNKRDKKIYSGLSEFKRIAEKQYNMIVFSVMLKGSQNYNLDDGESDIDANLVFIPSLKQLRHNTKYELETDYGKCTCHNLYSFAEIVAKGNPQWVEVCHTKYKLGNDLEMFKHYKINPSALKGMVMEKVTAFSKLYPSREKYIKEFGYDPKQLHHIIRLVDLIDQEVPIIQYHSEHREEMLDIKRGRFCKNLTEAEELRDKYVEILSRLYEQKKLEYKVQEVDYDLLDSIYMEHLCKLN